MTERSLSRRNERVREARRLLRDAGARREEGLWVLEGPNLAAEVVRSGLPVRLWLFAEGDAFPELRAAAARRGEEAVVVGRHAVQGLSDTRAPQGVLCVVPAPVWHRSDLVRRPGPVVALDGVQDPGNLGTIARSAEAAGAAGLLLGPSCVDAGNPKALRASAGSLLRVPAVGVEDLAAAAREGGRAVYATAGRGGIPYDEADLTAPFTLLVGQEGRGLSPELLSSADAALTIPMEGAVESLNAATAASVVLFEALRQRRRAR